MNADRHALNAALEYSAKQDQEIQRLTRSSAELRAELRSVRRQLEDVKAAVGLKDTAPEPPFPEGMAMQPKLENRCRERNT